ncbi:hypothetical protein BD779DRAFT_1547375 [Infundibulicybe gibba]|nr:hypothetical protein BD779DRAFT_1547375 [Infundibulicybe gibba]
MPTSNKFVPLGPSRVKLCHDSIIGSVLQSHPVGRGSVQNWRNLPEVIDRGSFTSTIMTAPAILISFMVGFRTGLRPATRTGPLTPCYIAAIAIGLFPMHRPLLGKVCVLVTALHGP